MCLFVYFALMCLDMCVCLTDCVQAKKLFMCMKAIFRFVCEQVMNVKKKYVLRQVRGVP